ncbi:hypothetical protein GQ53DRAFT_743901 [Thozetella sp. PMI_491]|nr:hypothetical protein GQ53DRAFT_743901 [Thozetella sp. PMI_491]
MLDRIPPELVMHIVSFVDAPGLLSLRLTCRKLYADSFPPFAREFFGSVNINFCIGTLPRFQKIAQDENLRKHVREIRVGMAGCRYTGCRELSQFHHPFGLGYHWIREASGCLDASSPRVAQFCSLVAGKFLNCSSVSIRDGDGDFEPRVATEKYLSPTDVVHIMLLSVAGLNLRSFRVEFLLRGSILTTSELPRRLIHFDGFLGPWATALTELRLNWDHEGGTVDVTTSLIAQAKSLRRLHLDFNRDSLSTGFVSQLAGLPQLPPITHLSLRLLRDMSPTVLLAFLCRLQNSLVHLHLSAIPLHLDGWRAVFASCRRNLSRLDCFSVHNPRKGPGFSPWFFCSLLHWDGVPNSGKLEISIAPIRGTRGVNGVRITSGQEAMQAWLLGLEKCISSEPSLHVDKAKASPLPQTLLIAKGMRAKIIRGRDFITAFDRLPKYIQ